MNNSKLIQILRTFSKDEWADFEKLVESSFFNKGRNLIPFVKALKKFYPDFSGKKLTKEYLYLTVHKGKTYNDYTMKSSLSRLVTLAEEFLMQMRLNKPDDRKLALLYEFALRRIDNRYSSYKKRIESGYTYELLKNAELKEIEQYHCLLNSSTKEYARKVIEAADIKNIYFVLNMLQHFIIFNSNQDTFNVSSADNLSNLLLRQIDIDKFIDELNKRDVECKDYALLNYYLYKSEIEPINIEHYQKAVVIYYKIADNLSHHDKFNYFRFLEAYLIVQIRTNILKREWAEKERYQLIKTAIAKNIYSFSPEEPMSPVTYRNAFMASLRQKDFEFANELMEILIRKILPNFQANIKNYFSAFYYFEMKDYGKAMEALSKIKFLEKDLYEILYKSELRNLKLMIFFELNHIENFISEADSYKHYLRNSKDVSAEHKKRNLTFVNNSEKLLRARVNERYEIISELKVKLNKDNIDKNFYNRWLLRTTDEILQSGKK